MTRLTVSMMSHTHILVPPLVMRRSDVANEVLLQEVASIEAKPALMEYRDTASVDFSERS